MIEWTITGNLGRDASKNKSAAYATVCANIPIQGSSDTEPVWIDIQAKEIGLAAQLLALKKGDGIVARGLVRINYYEHSGRSQKGWIMELNQLIVTHRK